MSKKTCNMKFQRKELVESLKTVRTFPFGLWSFLACYFPEFAEHVHRKMTIFINLMTLGSTFF